MLQEDETLPMFVEESIRQGVLLRQMRRDFIERGLASAEEAEQSGEYVDADDVLRELDEMCICAERTDL